VDLKKGNVRDAASRAEPLYTTRPDPEVGVIYGAALRQLPNADRSRARQVLEDAAKSPKGRAAYLELARLYREDGKYAEAQDAYGLAIKYAPPHTIDAALELATLKFDVGDAATARDTIDGLRVDAPDDFVLAIECARIHTAVGDPDGAQKCLDAAAKLDAPANLKWRIGKERGRLDLAKREYPQAAAELKKAIQAWPDDVELRLLLIDASLLMNDDDTTNATLQEVLKKWAGFPEADLAVGRVKLAFSQAPQAVEKFAAADKALTARGAPPRVIADARTWLGRAQYFNNDLTKAKQSFEEAGKLDPSAAEPQYQLGLLYYEQQQLPLSRAQFEKTVQLNPNYADAYFYLGDCARQMKDGAKAREALQSYLKLAPKGDFAAEARRMLAGG
jgi:tetratricopeptide (TPR) repeat protein